MNSQLQSISLTRYSISKTYGYKRITESEKCIYIHQGGWQYKGNTGEGTAPGIAASTSSHFLMNKKTSKLFALF